MISIETGVDFKLFKDDEWQPLLVHLEYIVHSRAYDEDAKISARRFLEAINYATEGRDLLTWNDLFNSDRLEFILTINIRLRSHFARWERQVKEDTFGLWPFRELQVKTPGSQSVWNMRWLSCGVPLANNRMIAAVDHPIWVKLSPFGVPCEPFDFGWEALQANVSVREAVDCGLSFSGTVRPRPVRFPAGLFFFDTVPQNMDELAWMQIRAWFNRRNAAEWSDTEYHPTCDIASHWLEEALRLFSAQKAVLGERAGTTIIEYINYAFKFGLANDMWQSAQAYRCTAEVLDLLGNETEAMGYYEAALECNQNIGVKRKCAALRKRISGRVESRLNDDGGTSARSE